MIIPDLENTMKKLAKTRRAEAVEKCEERV